MKTVFIIVCVALVAVSVYAFFQISTLSKSNIAMSRELMELKSQTPKVIVRDTTIYLPSRPAKAKALSAFDSLQIAIEWSKKNPEEQTQLLISLSQPQEWVSPFDFDAVQGLRLRGNIVSTFLPLTKEGTSEIWIDDVTLPPPHVVTNTVEIMRQRPFIEFGFSLYAGKTSKDYTLWYGGGQVIAYINTNSVRVLPSIGFDSQKKSFVQLSLEYLP